MNFKSFALSALFIIAGATSMKAIPYSPEYLEATQADETTGNLKFIPKGKFRELDFTNYQRKRHYRWQHGYTDAPRLTMGFI